MEESAIEAFLKQKIGLDARSIGSSTLARAVYRRMTECSLSDKLAYLTRLQTSTQELEQLIEEVIVPETWFFRNRQSLTFLEHYVKSEWLPTHLNRQLRILSVPCSTGEEPYSIAITLLEAGLTPKHFHIDAVDISKKSLVKAQQAIYCQNSFRRESLAFSDSVERRRYFTQVGEAYQLCEFVRSLVNFAYGNLLDPCFLINKAPYDVIFCRNLLIYFDQAARERTFRALNRLLTQKGLLFVGHSETGQKLISQFVPVRYPLAFAFHKPEEQSRLTQTRSFASRTGQQPRMNNFVLPIPSSQSSTPIAHRSTASHSPSPVSLLETAKRLADQGQLKEAATLCETYLSQNRLSVDAYVLLGLVRQATGDEELAEQCFHQAIYLEPNHYEALMHLALLKEHRGEVVGATILQRRIQRLHKLQGK